MFNLQTFLHTLAYSENDRTAERICKEGYVSQMLFGIPPCAAFTSTFTFSEDLKFHSDQSFQLTFFFSLIYFLLFILASLGFSASSGIIHVAPALCAQSMQPSLQRIPTRRDDKPCVAAVSEADMLVYNTYTTNMVCGGLYGWKNDCGKAKRKGIDAGCTWSDAWRIGQSSLKMGARGFT